jgi:Ca2+-binding EF-hand superfamily protein
MSQSYSYQNPTTSGQFNRVQTSYENFSSFVSTSGSSSPMTSASKPFSPGGSLGNYSTTNNFHNASNVNGASNAFNNSNNFASNGGGGGNSGMALSGASFNAPASNSFSSGIANNYNMGNGSSNLCNINSFAASSSNGLPRETVGRIANDLLKLGNEANCRIGNMQQENNLSEVETAILRSSEPIEINETEEITVNGQRGIWANKNEAINWRGIVPISQYEINQDTNPEVICKRSQQKIVYTQEIASRYLKPPTPPPPGEIIITQEANKPTPPAPPIVIRQQPPRPLTPEPLIIREAPPQPPAAIGRKMITIGGKRLPPPPRKVVIERLAPLPCKPQSVLVERWLPYSQVKRRVIFNRPTERDPVIVKPRNIIVQWEAPQVEVRQDYKYCGIVNANPADYVQRYGNTLRSPNELPQFVRDIRPPAGVVLAAECVYNPVHELEGDVEALKLIDLDREGLSQYKNFVNSLQSRDHQCFNMPSSAYQSSLCNLGLGQSEMSSNVAEIFSTINLRHDGRITQEEAEKLMLKLNSKFGRAYGENEVRAFFKCLDKNNDGSIDFDEFKRAFMGNFSC